MSNDGKSKSVSAESRAGWKVSTFCEAAGLSRSYLYMLPKDRRPRSVKVGKRRVIVEAPADWLRRIGESN